jgi:hypothetical protein
MAGEFMGRFYAARRVQLIGATQHSDVSSGPHESPVAMRGQKLHLFQMNWRMDKIPRRGANRGNKRLFGLSYH